MELSKQCFRGGSTPGGEETEGARILISGVQSIRRKMEEAERQRLKRQLRGRVSSAVVKEQASSTISLQTDKIKGARAAFWDIARKCRPPSTTLVLEMVFAADAKTIASAIAEGVKPRHAATGVAPEDVTALASLIFDGVKAKGGKATKGTTFRFDCTEFGVGLSVDGQLQGEVMCEKMGWAFVDVFLDEKAVSPQLMESCVRNWYGP